MVCEPVNLFKALPRVNSLVTTVVTMFPWDVACELGLVTEGLDIEGAEVELEVDVRDEGDMVFVDIGPAVGPLLVTGTWLDGSNVV